MSTRKIVLVGLLLLGAFVGGCANEGYSQASTAADASSYDPPAPADTNWVDQQNAADAAQAAAQAQANQQQQDFVNQQAQQEQQQEQLQEQLNQQMVQNAQSQP